MTSGRRAILLDVDTGIDDSLALLYACASPEAELVAVTCLAGNVAGELVEENTRAVLELAGRGDVEVALGAEVPLVRPLVVTPETHGPRGIGHATLPPPKRPRSERHGADVIVELARSRPGELALVTLGPLTNLAIALEREPDLPRLLGRWVLMGGAYGAPGNTTPTAEWNIHVDPDAAKLAFAGWARAIDADPTIPRALAMGLDVTERARLLPGRVEAIAATAAAATRGGQPAEPPRPNRVVRFLEDALRFYFEFHDRFDGFYGAFIHDPLVVAATLDPSLVETVPSFVDVETAGELTTGTTIADRRGHRGRRPNVDLAVEADAEEFLRRLVARVGALAATVG